MRQRKKEKEMTRLAIDINNNEGCCSNRDNFCKYILNRTFKAECRLFNSYLDKGAEGYPIRCIDCINAERLNNGLELLPVETEDIPF